MTQKAPPMTKIEQVARALCIADGIDPDADSRKRGSAMADIALDNPANWATYTNIQRARAAIEAMREPTDAMYIAALRESRDAGYGHCHDAVGSACYRAMIQAALNEGKE